MARTINATHDAFETRVRTSLDLARRCGELLYEARRKVPHGQWMAWVEGNCQFSIGTAENYMKVATHWPTIRRHRKSQPVAIVTMKMALRLISFTLGARGPSVSAPAPVAEVSVRAPHAPSYFKVFDAVGRVEICSGRHQYRLTTRAEVERLIADLQRALVHAFPETSTETVAVSGIEEDDDAHHEGASEPSVTEGTNKGERANTASAPQTASEPYMMSAP